MHAKLKAKPMNREGVDKPGAKLARSWDGGKSSVREDGAQRGFTLVEAMVVVLIIGFLAALAVVQVNKAWQRSRLEGAAGTVQSFLQSAYTYMVNNRAPVFVRLVMSSAGPTMLAITQNSDGSGTVFATYKVPNFVSLSTTDPTTGALDAATVWPCGACPPATCTIGPGTPGVLECDTMGRAMNISCSPPEMVSGVQSLVLTHVNMVRGSLQPRIVYTIQIPPVWKARLLKAVS